LAAAYAVTKDLARAIHARGRAIELSRSQGLDAAANSLASQRKKYEEARPGP
jgi:hypothetical protein